MPMKRLLTRSYIALLAMAAFSAALAVLAGGHTLAVALILALAFAKQRTFKVLAFIGATALLLSGVVALWQIVAEPIIQPGLAR